MQSKEENSANVDSSSESLEESIFQYGDLFTSISLSLDSCTKSFDELSELGDESQKHITGVYEPSYTILKTKARQLRMPTRDIKSYDRIQIEVALENFWEEMIKPDTNRSMHESISSIHSQHREASYVKPAMICTSTREPDQSVDSLNTLMIHKTTDDEYNGILDSKKDEGPKNIETTYVSEPVSGILADDSVASVKDFSDIDTSQNQTILTPTKSNVSVLDSVQLNGNYHLQERELIDITGTVVTSISHCLNRSDMTYGFGQNSIQQQQQSLEVSQTPISCYSSKSTEILNTTYLDGIGAKQCSDEKHTNNSLAAVEWSVDKLQQAVNSVIYKSSHLLENGCWDENDSIKWNAENVLQKAHNIFQNSPAFMVGSRTKSNDGNLQPGEDSYEKGLDLGNQISRGRSKLSLRLEQFKKRRWFYQIMNDDDSSIQSELDDSRCDVKSISQTIQQSFMSREILVNERSDDVVKLNNVSNYSLPVDNRIVGKSSSLDGEESTASGSSGMIRKDWFTFTTTERNIFERFRDSDVTDTDNCVDLLIPCKETDESCDEVNRRRVLLLAETEKYSVEDIDFVGFYFPYTSSATTTESKFSNISPFDVFSNDLDFRTDDLNTEHRESGLTEEATGEIDSPRNLGIRSAPSTYRSSSRSGTSFVQRTSFNTNENRVDNFEARDDVDTFEMMSMRRGGRKISLNSLNSGSWKTTGMSAPMMQNTILELDKLCHTNELRQTDAMVSFDVLCYNKKKGVRSPYVAAEPDNTRNSSKRFELEDNFLSLEQLLCMSPNDKHYSRREYLLSDENNNPPSCCLLLLAVVDCWNCYRCWM